MDSKNLDTHSVILVEATGDAAFAIDAQGQIIAWNLAAESMLGHSAQEVLGRQCAEVICGRDVFGNLYCDMQCNPRQQLARHDTVKSFDLHVPTALGETIGIRVFSVLIQGPSAADFTIAHLLWPTPEQQCKPANHSHDPCADQKIIDKGGDGAPSLTAKEIEVLRHLGDGLSVSALAALLCVSQSTIRSHIQNILHKCGVHSTRSAIAIARQHNLI